MGQGKGGQVMDGQHSELWTAHQGLVKAHNNTAHVLADANRELEQRVAELEATVNRMAQVLARIQEPQAILQAA